MRARELKRTCEIVSDKIVAKIAPSATPEERLELTQFTIQALLALDAKLTPQDIFHIVRQAFFEIS
jgi:hypothetical protein